MKKLILSSILVSLAVAIQAQVPVVPPQEELDRPFGSYDETAFQSPSKVYYPETWFHFIGGNVATNGITADLEAIAAAGFSGIHLFHGQFGGAWPGVETQIPCLSSSWNDAVQYTAKECKRLGLRFTMQNCPGWAMSGGPWIQPQNAMRHLVWSRTDAEGGTIDLKLAQPQPSDEDWRNYQDITVLAFPTPLDDTGTFLTPESTKSNDSIDWKGFLSGSVGAQNIPAASEENPHWVEITFASPVKIRTLEFPSVNSLLHARCYEPGVTLKLQAVLSDGSTKDVLNTELPQASWQDDKPVSFACSEVEGVKTYKFSLVNKYNISLNPIRLYSGARKNNWESEAGWTLRSIERTGDQAKQAPEAYIPFDSIRDLTAYMDSEGNLKWESPGGKWTILRIGHVNTGMKNGPAPAEGTGWECNKLSESGAMAHYAGYIGKLSGENGPLAGGLLNGMLMDSWECKTQTWTPNMENEFERVSNYSLRKWLPAVFGYVIDDQETTYRFLYDWRRTIGDLFVNQFYGRMAKMAKENNLSITYETAAGDIFPADILEYYKYADVPMCEFWQPFSEGYVGSLNFKPIKPTASAARMYGKPRVSAEAFTSFSLTWDEHWEMLKEVANINWVEGVSHLVFHTYTHNPRTDFLPPGTSFGSGIGTPFLRGQTWWKHVPEFTTYLARCNYMLERGKPVSDVLWYLGDEINHKPDQEVAFPTGYKYDYCNPDVLLNRLSVQDGLLTTPEGIHYRLLWIPDSTRMHPETLEKLYSLIHDGANVLANPPKGLVTLSGGEESQKRFDAAVNRIWGRDHAKGERDIGKGHILSGVKLIAALKHYRVAPDVIGDALWVHRQIEGADWYFICAPKGKNFNGTMYFRTQGLVSLWDPLTGNRQPISSTLNGDYTSVDLDLPQAGCCFLVFTPNDDNTPVINDDSPETIQTLENEWTLTFPEGWGAPASVKVAALSPWKDLDVSNEAKAFSGTVSYTTSFDVDAIDPSIE
ncbi:MAG: hypothetical protein J5672_06940, partial [Verrucomicrobia bacterium]|nr:hypothetical protein [Verrucomicrobiota bacterium]